MKDQKFSLKTFVFMMKSVFKSSPILFPLLIIIVVTSIGVGAFSLYMIRDITNEVVLLISGSGDLRKTVFLVAIYLFLELFILLFLDWAREYVEWHYHKQSEVYFSNILLYKLGNLPQESMYNKDVYEKFQFTYQNNYMFYDLPWVLVRFVIDFGLHKLLYIGIIYAFNFWIGLYCTILFLTNIILSGLISNKVGQATKKMVKPRRHQQYNKNMLTGKSAVKETKIYGLERFFFKRVKKYHNLIQDTLFRVRRLNSLVVETIATINYMFRVGLTILLLYMVFQGKLDVGEATLIQLAGITLMNASFTFKQPIEQIVRFVSSAPTMISFMFPLSKEEQAEIKKKTYDEFSLKLGDFKSIELRDVTYSYPSRVDEQVKNVNLKINKGEVISILGYNGSGKTTTTKLLSGVLSPKTGDVFFNNQKITKLDIKEYYKYFGIGFQDFCKYGLTLKENIEMGRIESSNEDDLFKATKKANLKAIINKMPEGLDTFLGKEFRKKGQEISGGEWQRIILSRAYMGEPEILILDEPTASIDPFEEERMLTEFDNILKDKTAVLISHRLSFARLADRIVIMQDGEIIEQGSHEELLSNQKYYYELFKSQSDLYNGGDDCEE